MRCRDFQIEIEEPKKLSRTAESHLTGCADCQRTHFEQIRLLEMLGGLERIEAPKDFNFQLKARIARGVPNNSPTALFPALRYVLPLGLVIVLLSFVALSGLYFVEEQSPETVQSPVSAPPPDASVPSAPELAVKTESPGDGESEEKSSGPPNPVVENKSPVVIVKNPQPDGGSRDLTPPTRPKVISNQNADSGGSRVLSVEPGREVITPRGLNTNQQVMPPQPSTSPNTFTVTEVLSLIGIETETENAGRIVKSVTQNSPAERSGIRIGDLIEAIDNRPLIGENLRERSFQGEKLTVLRGTRRLEITIRTQ